MQVHAQLLRSRRSDFLDINVPQATRIEHRAGVYSLLLLQKPRVRERCREAEWREMGVSSFTSPTHVPTIPIYTSALDPRCRKSCLGRHCGEIARPLHIFRLEHRRT